jgi:hypothetical protein
MISGGSLTKRWPQKQQKSLCPMWINSVGLRRRGFTTEKLERFRISIEYYIKKITIPLKL